MTAKDNNQLIERAKKLDGVLGYMLKTSLRDVKGFLGEIQGYIRTAETLRTTSEAVYHQGAMETLLQTGEDQGIFNPPEEQSPKGAWS